MGPDVAVTAVTAADGWADEDVLALAAAVESASPVHGVATYVQRHLCDLMVLMTHNRTGVERWP